MKKEEIPSDEELAKLKNQNRIQWEEIEKLKF